MRFTKLLALPAAAYLLYRLNAQGKTSEIEGADAICELKKVPINGTELAVLIRGSDKNNPVLLCVTGGPCGTDIPLLKKYEQELEKHFTVVHYDQRGAGKSFFFKENYRDLVFEDHVDDLLALSEYLKDYLHKDQLYLLGHSYGTFLASLAADRKPEYYKAYIGIGQMSDTAHAEYYSLLDCLEAAEKAGNEKDVQYLRSISDKVKDGEMLTPRNYVRKYKFALRKEQHALRDLLKNIVLGPEYNILDGIKYFYAAAKYAMPLAMQSVNNPLSEQIREVKIPTYFIMGKYDGMTNTRAAKEYFDSLQGTAKKEFIVFENSAHSPQIEENEKFVSWMCNDLLQENEQM